MTILWEINLILVGVIFGIVIQHFNEKWRGKKEVK